MKLTRCSYHWLRRAVSRIPRRRLLPLRQFRFWRSCSPLQKVSPADPSQIATTFLGVYLLTTFSDPETESSEADLSSQNPSRRKQSQRAISSASFNLLLPTSAYEHTPLLIHTDEQRVIGTPHTALGAMGKLRLMKRSSTGDFTPTLGLNSQAGFLLIATTPPSSMTAANTMRRDRSASRRQGDVESEGSRRTSQAGR